MLPWCLPGTATRIIVLLRKMSVPFHVWTDNSKDRSEKSQTPEHTPSPQLREVVMITWTCAHGNKRVVPIANGENTSWLALGISKVTSRVGTEVRYSKTNGPIARTLIRNSVLRASYNTVAIPFEPLCLPRRPVKLYQHKQLYLCERRRQRIPTPAGYLAQIIFWLKLNILGNIHEISTTTQKR